MSAQNRVRLYWANFEITQPLDKGITIKDILEIPDFTKPAGIRGRRLSEDNLRKDSEVTIPIVQCLEVKSVNTDKSNCLTTVEKDNVLTNMPSGRHLNAFKNNLPFRKYTLTEYCRLQTVPENYFDGIVSDHQAKKMLGNGWTVDVIAHILGDLVNQNISDNL